MLRHTGRVRWGPAVAATAAGAVLAASAAGSASVRKPDLTVAAGAGGVKLAGVRFAPGERVAVTFRSGALWRRTARTTRAGRFAVTLAGAHVDRCQGYVAVARGSSGDRAVEKVMPLACNPE